MILGVDIDGTLTNETEGHDYAKRTPNFKMIKWVNSRFELGDFIILWSSRWEADREVTRKWLKTYRVKYHTLILNKPKFDMIVDDIAKRPEEVLKSINHKVIL
ncbi:MAG: hypothetical protein WC346_18195 [Methanogenium sp.]|jgi:hypothetical protein